LEWGYSSAAEAWTDPAVRDALLDRLGMTCAAFLAGGVVGLAYAPSLNQTFWIVLGVSAVILLARGWSSALSVSFAGLWLLPPVLTGAYVVRAMTIRRGVEATS
jgi:hypothetical protein